MGMCDFIHINKNLLPLLDEEKNALSETMEWQTESLSNLFVDYYIKGDGVFTKSFDLKEESKRLKKTNRILYSTDFEKLNERYENVNFHGLIHFYSQAEGVDYEFTAKFTDGVLIQIVQRLENRKYPLAGSDNKVDTFQLLSHLADRNFDSFIDEWSEIKSNLTEADRQELLKDIMEIYYYDEYSSFYIKVFNEILEQKTTLDFNIDHWAPTFLSLVVDNVSFTMFEYFVKNGANINFIGDTNFIAQEELEDGDESNFNTCLDFANIKYADMLYVDYNFRVPFHEEDEQFGPLYNPKEEITITKEFYFNLVNQAQYLQNLVFLDKLIGHLKSSGGKTYEELKTTKEELRARIVQRKRTQQ